MKDFFKYISAGEEDKEWGLFLNVAGRSRTAAGKTYPSPDHPSGYYFNWKNGRKLDEYQINYITEGSGILETESGRVQIRPGTLLIIRPGIWHRYRPLKKTGWVENYIGFEGELAEQLLSKSSITLTQTCINCGVHEEFIDTYYKIFDLVQKEEPGFQYIASGMIIKLLGYIVAWEKKRNFTGTHIEKVIQAARFHIRENIKKDVDLRKLSEDNYIGYSYFRKMFKKYTGISPHQYHLDLKIMRAKELILTTDKSMKEISYELGFQSIHYFSRLFKQKVGQNPTQLRSR